MRKKGEVMGKWECKWGGQLEQVGWKQGSGPSWAGIGPRLKEMGLGGAMGGMGSGCL